MNFFQWLKVFSRLRAFKGKVKTASSGKKVFYFLSILIQVAIGAGLGVGAFFCFNASKESGLGIFLIVIAAGLLACAVVLVIYEIVKLCYLLASCFGDKSNKE